MSAAKDARRLEKELDTIKQNMDSLNEFVGIIVRHFGGEIKISGKEMYDFAWAGGTVDVNQTEEETVLTYIPLEDDEKESPEVERSDKKEPEPEVAGSPPQKLSTEQMLELMMERHQMALGAIQDLKAIIWLAAKNNGGIITYTKHQESQVPPNVFIKVDEGKIGTVVTPLSQ